MPSRRVSITVLSKIIDAYVTNKQANQKCLYARCAVCDVRVPFFPLVQIWNTMWCIRHDGSNREIECGSQSEVVQPMYGAARSDEMMGEWSWNWKCDWVAWKFRRAHSRCKDVTVIRNDNHVSEYALSFDNHKQWNIEAEKGNDDRF